ncbi:MAG: asparagine synthase-related protein, partial [Candidatus Methylumidiphilus sp.]
MSGICGWINNTLESDACAFIVQKMAEKNRINKSHACGWKISTHEAVAAIGAPSNIGTCRFDGLTAAVCGSIRFANGELEKTAKEQGLAQAILDGYRRDGVNFLQQLSGPFALCIADAANRRTLLAIDKLGIGSLFYTIRRDQLVFSSNAKALGLHPNAASEIDPQAIYDYLYFHMVPSPRCIFRGVAKLLPGQYLLFENNQVQAKFYWQPSYQERLEAEPKKLETEFLDILDTSVARASAGLNAGAFLSGGTDSSTVAGTLQKLSGFPANTYSIGFDAEGFDETHYARLAA